MIKLFNLPGSWMDNISPDLLMRFWEKKGMPDTLLVYRYGVRFYFTNTPYGVIIYLGSPWREDQYLPALFPLIKDPITFPNTSSISLTNGSEIQPINLSDLIKF